MLTKPIKSPQVSRVNAAVSSPDKDTFKHGAQRRDGVRGEEGGKRQRVVGRRDEGKKKGTLRRGRPGVGQKKWDDTTSRWIKTDYDKPTACVNNIHPPPPHLISRIIYFL